MEPKLGIETALQCVRMCMSVQYLSEECSGETLGDFKAALEEREKVRLQLISDLNKKRQLLIFFCFLPINSILFLPYAWD